MEEAQQSVSTVEECGGVGRGHRKARLRVCISVTDGVIGRPTCREECGLCFPYVAGEPCPGCLEAVLASCWPGLLLELGVGLKSRMRLNLRPGVRAWAGKS